MRGITQAFGARFDLDDLLIVGIALTLALTGISSLLSPLGNIAVSAGVVLAWLALGHRRARRRRGHWREADFQSPRRGILFTVGLGGVKDGTIADLVVDRLHPELVGFLLTGEVEDLVQIEDFKRRKGVVVTCERLDPGDFEGCRRAAARALEWLLDQGVERDDIVVDITGGLKNVSLAAFLAADDAQVEAQYIKSEYNAATNKPIPGTQQQVLLTTYHGTSDPTANG
ncbi:MAG: hypothetical protein ACRDZ4_21595 [Egibacteraceae bacterium]